MNVYLRLDEIFTHITPHLFIAEKFSEALVDYKKALDIKHEVLSEDDRQLAEAHYKYALALESVPNESDKAGPEIQKAIDVLKKRKAALEEKDQGKGKGKATEADTDTSKEIAELGELIPEMELKVKKKGMQIAYCIADD